MKKTYLILLIGSNLENIKLLDSGLKKLNYSCISTREGIKGLLLAQNHQPDLVILDILISDVAAIEVIDHLKNNSNTPKIPIIVSLPKNQKQECNLFLIAGASYCVDQPYNLTELETAIKCCL